MLCRSALLLGFVIFVSMPSSRLYADELLDSIDRRYDFAAGMARTLWEYAEVGYIENRSSELIKTALRSEGFAMESGVAGIPTAFIASYGSGKPIVAILAEYDALPGINQDSVATRKPIAGKTAGHACGHNLFAAGSTIAAISIKEWLSENNGKGTIRLYGTPAEEGGSGKVYMVRAGLFEDVDFALHWHPGDRNFAGAITTLANRSAKFRFRGTSAHAAKAPEKARSALDAVESFNHMVNLMREHVPHDTRIHYVITEGGNAPNVVPDFAEAYYYLRHPSANSLRRIWLRLEAAAEGAAMGTGTEVEWEIIHGNHAVLANETLARTVREKLVEVGGISYDRTEQRFADQVYGTLDQPTLKLGSENAIQPYWAGLDYGSTDVGDVSIAVPTAGVMTATWVPGAPAHSWQSTAASGMSIGFKGALIAAKTLALTTIELFENSELRKAATEEFEDRRGEDFSYEALLGDRSPPLDYRK